VRSGAAVPALVLLMSVAAGCADRTAPDELTYDEYCAAKARTADLVAQVQGDDVVVTWTDVEGTGTEYWVARRAPGDERWTVLATFPLGPGEDRRFVDEQAAALGAQYTVSAAPDCRRVVDGSCEDHDCPRTAVAAPGRPAGQVEVRGVR
jgi:hypothetical protein